jgi:hypothetical protein
MNCHHIFFADGNVVTILLLYIATQGGIGGRCRLVGGWFLDAEKSRFDEKGVPQSVPQPVRKSSLGCVGPIKGEIIGRMSWI